MKLIKNKKIIILSIVIIVLLLAIGWSIYGIYSTNKQQTIAEPIDEKLQELEDKNTVENNTIDTTRKYNYGRYTKE